MDNDSPLIKRNDRVDDLHVMKQILFDNNMFSKIYNVNKDLPLEIREAILTKNFDEIVDVITNTYTDSQNIFYKDFIYFGHIGLKEEYQEDDKIFEFYMHGFKSFDEVFYEFMINDVTKTKLIEENRLKEKTLILGKISHEFKNPIIVMEEIIDQIIENDCFNRVCESDRLYLPEDQYEVRLQCLEKINFIKNLCQYIITLIKDFEVVASIENKQNLDVYFSEFNIHEYLKHVEEIVNTLINKKRQNFNNSIDNLKVTVDHNIQMIKTDPIRLKQILINLISNAIKFTEEGTIEIQLKKVLNENSIIRNSPKDSSSLADDTNSPSGSTELQKSNNIII